MKPPPQNSDRIDLLRSIFADFENELSKRVPDSKIISVDGLPGCSRALAALSLPTEGDDVTLCVTKSPGDLEELFADLRAFARPTGRELAMFPVDATSGAESADPDEIGARTLLLRHLAKPNRKQKLVIATCIQALRQKAAAPGSLRERSKHLQLGDDVDPADLVAWLDAAGYEIKSEVEEKGSASARGCIIDVWPYTAEFPLRLEFFGNEVESLRKFDPATQRSVGRCEAFWLEPVITKEINSISLLEALPPRATIAWFDYDEIQEAAKPRDASEADVPASDDWDQIQHWLQRRDISRQLIVGSLTPSAGSICHLPINSLPGIADLSRDTSQPDLISEARNKLIQRMVAQTGRGDFVSIALDTPGAIKHLRDELKNNNVLLVEATLSAGFEWLDAGLTVATQADLFGRRQRRRQPLSCSRARPDATGGRMQDLEGLETGSLVVHLDHGIGRFVGLQEISFDDRTLEVITVEYAGDAKLHVPINHAHLLSRYVGMGDHTTRLHKLGGKRWTRERSDAERAVEDLAASLLDTQAQRATSESFAYPPDTPWDHEFAASFPYEETPDQHRVIDEVRSDMLSRHPMDRLICGDAGYGKTELAMRAAFKVVMQEKQVAVLVPTTVLALQHYETFSDRMQAYPVRIEMLSRFRTASQKRAIIQELAEGKLDIVIGTHALLQPSVTFKALGLVVIDEEQRFGVKHKEKLKSVRSMIDVLTMTATPIPRTLYMSLTGARDLSLLQTPPQQRLPIETRVMRDDDKAIREAVLHELHRDGQIYFLYNRVLTIDAMYDRLCRIVPEARILVGHGQMPARQLSRVMHEFSAGHYDILLCTTIVESGVDIPQANTILIHRADRFGIADLYQLRGRVGRSNRKAFAYLMLPHHGNVDTDARKRIRAVRIHSALGAGFRLAMKDLEIRGAGNLLGAAQSGHISAVGFSLYCQLLKQTVSQLKGEPLPPVIDVDVRIDRLDLSPRAEDPSVAASIPVHYLEDESLRLGTYRRIAEATNLEELEEVKQDLRDRVGPLPQQLERLLTISNIRIRAAEIKLSRIDCIKGRMRFYRNGEIVPGSAVSVMSEKPDDIIKQIQNALLSMKREMNEKAL